jgi:hypothetical protein
VHALVEELLDSEDVVVLLFDGRRAVSYLCGFGLSPCQHELLAVEIEQLVRARRSATLGTAAMGTRQGGKCASYNVDVSGD